MQNTDPRQLTASIRRMAARGAEADAPTDEKLVGRFVDGGDAAAFELLVWRHGPMVWATCRRILCHLHDVEDAFQASFLALARNAGSIGDRRSVGGWLHRVAANAALKSKARRTRTGLPDEIPARAASDAGELAHVLDEELERLPELPRTAFVLCCLEGMTSAEAARQLGCPAGTVDSRLHAARVRLRDRLTRRGFGPDALGGVPAGGSPPAGEWAAALGTSSGVAANASVDWLATQAGRIMTSGLLSIRCLAWTALVIGLTGSVWVVAGPASPPRPALTLRAPAPEPKAVGPRDGLIVLWRQGRPISVHSKTKEVKALEGFEGQRGAVLLGPDRKSVLVYVRHAISFTPKDPPKEDRLFIEWAGSGRKGLEEVEVEGVTLREAFWGADGRTVYGWGMRPRKGAKAFDLTKDLFNWSYDVRTRKVKRLDLPGNVSMLDRSRDGETLLVVWYDKPAGTPGTYRLGLLPAAGGKFVPLTKAGEATPADFRFSPDGKSALGRVYRDDGVRYVGDLVVFDLETRRRSPVATPKGARVHGACWSPDGERIAIVWEPKEAAEGREKEGGKGSGRTEYDWRITLARPDGTDAKEFYRGADYWYGSIDWR